MTQAQASIRGRAFPSLCLSCPSRVLRDCDSHLLSSSQPRASSFGLHFSHEPLPSIIPSFTNLFEPSFLIPSSYSLFFSATSFFCLLLFSSFHLFLACLPVTNPFFQPASHLSISSSYLLFFSATGLFLSACLSVTNLVFQPSTLISPSCSSLLHPIG